MTVVELRRKKMSWGWDYPHDTEPQLESFLILVLVDGRPVATLADDSSMLEAVLGQISSVNILRTGEW